MKDYIALHYPEKLSYDQLRGAINEAWESITPEYLGSLISEMPSRYEAVIAAQGMYTKY